MPDRRLLAAAVALALVLAAALAFITTLLLDEDDGARSLPAIDPASAHKLRIEISSPATGASVPLGDPVMVVLQALDGYPVATYELWVDGRLARRRAPRDAASSAIARMTWVPDAAGPHTLVARATSGDGAAAHSAPVAVQVDAGTHPGMVGIPVEMAEGATAASVAQAFGVGPENVVAPADDEGPANRLIVYVPPDAVPEGYAGEDAARPAPADPPPQPQDDAVPAAEGGGGDELPWGLEPLGGTAAPAAPTDLLAAHRDGCDVVLQWSDASDDETGFSVYRFFGGGDFRRIATLAPHDGGALSYTDRLIRSGHVEYYVSSTNEGGESESGLAAVDIPAGACTITAPPAEARAMTMLQLEITDLDTTSSFDTAWCYLSVARLEPYARIPNHPRVSLSPTRDGWNIAAFASGMSRRIFSQDPGAPVPVALECWARRGEEEPIALGSFAAEHASDEWDGRSLFAATDGFRVTYHIAPYSGEIHAVAIETPAIPSPFNVHQPSEEECTDYADFGGGDGAEAGAALWACAEIRDQLLVWDWRPNNAFPRSAISGFRIYVRSTGPPAGLETMPLNWYRLWDSSRGTQLSLAEMPPCWEPYEFKVTAVYERSEGFEEMESPPSAPFSIERRGCGRPLVEIEVDLVSMEVGLIDDGVGSACFVIVCIPVADFVAEAYGIGGFDVVRADGGMVDWGLSWVFWTHDCGGLGEIWGGACLAFDPRRLPSDNTLLWREERLSMCAPRWPEPCGDFATNHHTARVQVGDGDRLEFWFNIRDDDMAADDTICGTTEDYTLESEIDESRPIVLGPYTLSEWATLFEVVDWDNDAAALDDQDAPCEMQVWFTGLDLAR